MMSKIRMRLGLTFGLTLGLAFCFACANAASSFAAAPESLHSKPAAPHRSAQHEKPEPAKPFVPLTPTEAVQKANNYFNRTKTMIADFVQIGADGRRSEGKVFVEKPGRLRFEYAAPATLDVIADGTTVAVIDHKVGSIQQYFIWQTPLKFLLKDHIDLAKDTKVLNVTSEPDEVAILVEDQHVFGGTTRIKLIFDPATFTLKQWQVTDPQGYETLVSLFNQDFTTVPNPAYFQIYK